MTQKERQAHSRQEVLRAAMEEFGTKDYAAVSMECICRSHGISKGMMYHYYTGKDALFLLCVQRVFEALRAYLQQQAAALDMADAPEALRRYFLLRESFFAGKPLEKRVFESAMLHTPTHLRAQIERLHEPLNEENRAFLARIAERMVLRPGLSAAQAARYFENLERILPGVAACDQKEQDRRDELHLWLENTREFVDMALFGVLRQE